MSEGTPSKIIPQFVEPRKFAAHGVKLSGEVPSSAFKRLAEADIAVLTLAAELDFDIDEERRRAVTGVIRSQVSLLCQRCLEKMPYPIDVNVNWVVVWNEEQADKLPSSVEAWIAGEDAEDLYAMIEEELLLALPVAPVHTELCIDETYLRSGEEPIEEVSSVKNNPFQALAALKGETKN